ncbi:unnamed protein product [Closterium sp. Yama58-4]|nr:unnamed protein product [Closterium sp. Yama58-4]
MHAMLRLADDGHERILRSPSIPADSAGVYVSEARLDMHWNYGPSIQLKRLKDTSNFRKGRTRYKQARCPSRKITRGTPSHLFPPTGLRAFSQSQPPRFPPPTAAPPAAPVPASATFPRRPPPPQGEWEGARVAAAAVGDGSRWTGRHLLAACDSARGASGGGFPSSPAAAPSSLLSSSLIASSAPLSTSAVAKLLQTGNAAALLLLCQALFPASFSVATPTLALLHLLSSSPLLSPLSRLLSPFSRALAPLSRLLFLRLPLRPRLASSTGGEKGKSA